MRQRLLFFFLAGLLLLLVTIVVRKQFGAKNAPVQAPQASVIAIAVAARSLSAGDTIQENSIRFAPWPHASLPEGAIVRGADIVGRTLRTSLISDQPILTSSVVDAEAAGGILPLIIPSGMRAMSLAVDDVDDMAGLLLPHSRVDILISASVPNGSTAEQVSRIVLQDIEVVAVGERIDSGGERAHPAKVVTLLLQPSQTERLSAALHLGTLQFAMRGYRDRESVATSGVSSDQLLGTAPPPGPIHHASRVSSSAVEIIRDGKEHQSVEFFGGQPVEPNSDANPHLPTYVVPAQQPATAPPSDNSR